MEKKTVNRASFFLMLLVLFTVIKGFYIYLLPLYILYAVYVILIIVKHIKERNKD